MGVFSWLRRRRKRQPIPEDVGFSEMEQEDFTGASGAPPVPNQPPRESAYTKFKRSIGSAAEKVDETATAVGEDISGAASGLVTRVEEMKRTHIERMGEKAAELKLKNELAGQRQSLRTKGEDTWGQVERTAQRGAKIVKGLKTVLTMGGPVSPKRMELYVPRKQKGMYYDAESTRSLTMPGGGAEGQESGLKSVTTPRLGLLRQAGAPPMRRPQLPKPIGMSYQPKKVGTNYDLSMLRGLTLPKGTSRIEKTAIGEIQIHSGNYKDVLMGLKDAGYSPQQSSSVLLYLQKKGLVARGSDNTLELTGGK